MKHVQQQWTKGLNKRTDNRRGDPDRFSQLQNARIQERGNTLEVSRIQGFVDVGGDIDYDCVQDSVIHGTSIVVLWFDRSTNDTKVTITDVDTGQSETFIVNEQGDGEDQGDVTWEENFEGSQHVVGQPWRDSTNNNPVAGAPQTITVHEGEGFFGKGVQIKYLGHNASGSFPGSHRMEHPYQYFNVSPGRAYELSVDWYFESIWNWNTIGQNRTEVKRRLMTYGLSTPYNGILAGTPFTNQQAEDYVSRDGWHFNDTYEHTGFPYATGKMHGLISYVPQGETPPAGGQAPISDRWSVRCIWMKNQNSHPETNSSGEYIAGLDPNRGPTLGLYIYDQDRKWLPDKDRWEFGKEIPMDNSFSIEQNTWYTIKLYVQVNDTDEHNGIARLEVYDKATGSLINSIYVDDLLLQTEGNSNVDIHRLFFSTFFGGGDLRFSADLSPFDDNGTYARNDNYKMTKLPELKKVVVVEVQDLGADLRVFLQHELGIQGFNSYQFWRNGQWIGVNYQVLDDHTIYITVPNDSSIELRARVGNRYTPRADLTIHEPVPPPPNPATPPTVDCDDLTGKLISVEDTIFITPNNKQLNLINGTWKLNDFVSTTPILTLNAVSGGTLEQNQTYWYRARYVYFDGHKTKTNYPKNIRTTNTNRAVQLTIDLVDNLGDDVPIRIEIFRKTGTGNFFLIDTVSATGTTFTYTDTGQPNIQEIDEENYVWADSQTQEIVRDRLVRANNRYINSENTSELSVGVNTAIVDDGQQVLPYNTFVEVYNQVRRIDGTETLYKLQDTIETEDGLEDNRLQVSQVESYIPEDQFKEQAIFAKYSPFPSEDTIPFNTVEFYNANVPSIVTRNEPEVEQDRPINPHVFLGYRFVEVLDEADSTGYRLFTYDGEWDTAPPNQTSSRFRNAVPSGFNPNNNDIFNFELNPTDFGTGVPNGTSIGQPLPYSKAYVPSPQGSTNSWIYQIAFLEGLKQAVSAGRVRLRIKSSNVTGLSTSVTDQELIGLEVKVIGVDDATNVADGDLVDLIRLRPTMNNKVHLVLESGTPLDEITNLGVGNTNVRADYDNLDTPNFSPTLEFELIGLTAIDFGVDSTETDPVFPAIKYDYNYRLKLTDYTDFSSEVATLLHSTTMNLFSSIIPTNQGWTKRINNKFEFVEYNDWNFNVSTVTEDDLQTLREDYPNQLIWSDPYIYQSNASRVRNFEYTNFKNISAEYGEIIDLQYVSNVLLVFCERGVNRIAVGEVLTQQASGQTYVDSSSLLNNDFWVLKALPAVQKKSIVQYENVLFFCDGRDVWMFDGQFTNITHGSIEIDGDVESAGIDPKNKEYRITDGSQTWAYSIETDQWMGPYTYKDKTSSFFGDRMISVVGQRLVEHNKGNTFLGQPYLTLIESIANDMQDPTIVKLFRKFYVETNTEDPTILVYGKDDSMDTSIELENKPNKNGIYHVGINGRNKNGRYLSWRVITQVEDFVLRAVSFLYNPRVRR